MSDAPSIWLHGKVASITGGGAGIGRAITDTYAALGARIAALEIDPARAADLRDALGKNTLVIEGDARLADDVTNAFAAVAARFGTLNILCSGPIE